MFGVINAKYKTTLCRHWETTGQCQMAAKCHFAHGKQDLRSINDPLPFNSQQQQPQQLQQPNYSDPSNNNFNQNSYKTVPCKYFQQGYCQFGQSCNFSHGDSDKKMTDMGMNMNPSNNLNQFNQYYAQQQYYIDLNAKIVFTQLQTLLVSMNQLNITDPVQMQKLKTASELLNVGNSQACAVILNEIINRPECSKEEKEIYQKLLKDAQNIAIQQYGSDSNVFPK